MQIYLIFYLQMRPELMEVAIAGDASISRVRDLALKYFGTLEPKSFERGIADRKSNLSLIFMPPMDLNLTRHGELGVS